MSEPYFGCAKSSKSSKSYSRKLECALSRKWRALRRPYASASFEEAELFVIICRLEPGFFDLEANFPVRPSNPASPTGSPPTRLPYFCRFYLPVGKVSSAHMHDVAKIGRLGRATTGSWQSSSVRRSFMFCLSCDVLTQAIVNSGDYHAVVCVLFLRLWQF